PRRLKRECLLATAAEDERVAAFEPHDVLAPPGSANHQRVDLLLGQRVAAGPFTDEEPPRVARDPEHTRIDQRVVEHETGVAQPRRRLACEELRITGPSADQRDMTLHDD